MKNLDLSFRRRFLALGAALVALASVVAAPPLAASPHECREIAQRYTEGKRDLVERQVNVYFSQAAGKGCLDLVRDLVRDGASIRAKQRDGGTPLHQAVKAPSPDVARLLLDLGADIEARDLAGATPLYNAIDAGRFATVNLLIERGANPDGPGKSAASPLIVAAFNGHERIVWMLLERKTDPNFADNTGKSAMVYAAARGFTAIVERLLTAGVDANRRYGNDLTALMWAAGHSNDVPETDGVKTVALLHSHGARLDDADDRGRTALMIAAEVGRPAVIKFLLRRGAKAELKDKAGLSALDLAADEAVRKALGGKERAGLPR